MVDKAAVTHVNTDPKISEKCFQHLVEFMPQNTLAVRKTDGTSTQQQGVADEVAAECNVSL